MDTLLGRRAEDAAAMLMAQEIEPEFVRTGPDSNGIMRVVQVLDGGARLRIACFPAEPEM